MKQFQSYISRYDAKTNSSSSLFNFFIARFPLSKVQNITKHDTNIHS